MNFEDSSWNSSHLSGHWLFWKVNTKIATYYLCSTFFRILEHDLSIGKLRSSYTVIPIGEITVDSNIFRFFSHRHIREEKK